VINAVFFITNEIPKLEDVSLFHDLTLEDFNAGKYPKNEILQPNGYINLIREKGIGKYNEFALKKPIKGKYFVCIFLKAKRDDQNMDFSTTGCLGFLDEKYQEKYSKNIIKDAAAAAIDIVEKAKINDLAGGCRIF